MNDRFKFRVWNKENKKLYDWDFLEKTKEENTFFWVMHQAQNDCKHNILMQCTGLKDKNGKLIYELDYVRYANNKYKVEIDKFLGISLTNILNGDIIVMDDIVLFNCEVIGNEFESNTKI